MLVNVQGSAVWCVRVIGHLAQWPMCAWKCAVRQLSVSLHIYMHTSDTRVTARLHAPDVCMRTWTDPTVQCVHVNGEWAVWRKCAWNEQWDKCMTLCKFTCTRQTLGSLHVYMQLMRACKRALSDVFDNWAVSQMTYVIMKMCSESIVWLSAHLHAHVRHPGHCTFTCTWCVLVNVQWSNCLMCSCNWAVSRMTDVCMKMCSEPIVLLSAHLHAHIKHTGHCMFTCTWCVHVDVQWFDCLMCSCNWAVSPMADVCMNMCTEPFVWLSAHLHAHVRHTGYCWFTRNWCVHVKVQLFDCLMCSCNWAVGPMTDVCMKMCSEPIVWLSAHLYAHMGHCTFTCTM